MLHAWVYDMVYPATTAGAVPRYTLGGTPPAEEELPQPPAVRAKASQEGEPLCVFSFALTRMTV